MFWGPGRETSQTEVLWKVRGAGHCKAWVLGLLMKSAVLLPHSFVHNCTRLGQAEVHVGSAGSGLGFVQWGQPRDGSLWPWSSVPLVFWWFCSLTLVRVSLVFRSTFQTGSLNVKPPTLFAIQLKKQGSILTIQGEVANIARESLCHVHTKVKDHIVCTSWVA